MKLDRKQILSALETITVAGEGQNMVESGAVRNVLTFGDEVVVEVEGVTNLKTTAERASCLSAQRGGSIAMCGSPVNIVNIRRLSCLW